MATPCVYCDSRVERHDPVYVREDGDDEERAFCNYACLAAHVDEAALTTGACCEWPPG